MRFAWLLQIALILFVPPAAYVFVTRAKAPTARSLKGAALILAGTYALFFGSFIVGETLMDPGGWAAAAYIAAWIVPLIGLSLLAWRRPTSAATAFLLLIAGVIAVYAWSAIAPDAWRSFEDSVGPVRGLISFAIAVPAALLGWRRPVAAGTVLLALPILPAILVAMAIAGAPTAGVVPIAVLTAPAGLIGVLYLAGAAMERGPHSRPARPRPLSTPPRTA